MTITGAKPCPYCEGTFSKHAEDCPAMFTFQIAEDIETKSVREVYKLVADWRDAAIKKALEKGKQK